MNDEFIKLVNFTNFDDKKITHEPKYRRQLLTPKLSISRDQQHEIMSNVSKLATIMIIISNIRHPVWVQFDNYYHSVDD